MKYFIIGSPGEWGRWDPNDLRIAHITESKKEAAHIHALYEIGEYCHDLFTSDSPEVDSWRLGDRVTHAMVKHLNTAGPVSCVRIWRDKNVWRLCARAQDTVLRALREKTKKARCECVYIALDGLLSESGKGTVVSEEDFAKLIKWSVG